jgi:hypothetical protein
MYIAVDLDGDVGIVKEVPGTLEGQPAAIGALVLGQKQLEQGVAFDLLLAQHLDGRVGLLGQLAQEALRPQRCQTN